MPYIILFLIGIGVVIIVLVKSGKKNTPSPNGNAQPMYGNTETVPQIDINSTETKEQKNSPFERKYLLTKNEYYFYKELKRIADKYGLAVLSKIRFADIVQVKSSEVNSKSEWYSYFGKIKAKHIDFALADASNLYVLLIIELDDNSHNSSSAKESDDFKNEVLEKCGYKVIRTYGPNNLETMIVDALQLQRKEETTAEVNNG